MNLKKAATFLLLGSTALLGGCGETEYSAELTEKAEIVEVVYTPAQHGSAIGPTFSTSGNVGVAITSVDIPEVYAVVFQCEHGKFIIKRKDVWERAKTGAKVTVRYREEYWVTEKERRLVKYDFLGFDA